MTNKVLLGLIVALAIGVVVVGSTDKARQQPAQAITALEEKATLKGDVEVTAEDIAKTANDSKDLSTFATVAEAVDISTLLKEKGGAYTVFAPTNDAFKKSYGGSEESILASETKDTALDLLRYHIVPGQIDINSGKGEQILNTLQGGQITITHGKDGTIYINGVATVLSTEQTTGGSVVYVIDQVLNPKDGVVIEGPTPTIPTIPTGKKYRIMCQDNGDGTITYWDEVRNWFLGGWHQSSETVTVNTVDADHPNGQGCAWLPGWPKPVDTIKNLDPKDPRNLPEITKEDLGDLTKISADTREICTDEKEGSVIEKQEKKSFLFFWERWTTVSKSEQETSCLGK